MESLIYNFYRSKCGSTYKFIQLSEQMLLGHLGTKKQTISKEQTPPVMWKWNAQFCVWLCIFFGLLQISVYVVCLSFRCDWDNLLKIVRCEIISSCSNDDMDAYVLRYRSLRCMQYFCVTQYFIVILKV